MADNGSFKVGKYTILPRRDRSFNWEIVNPVLRKTEIGYASDLGWFKIGDGETPWNDLPYLKVEHV